MKCCIYDNPHTAMREAYQNGVFLGHISSNLLEQKHFTGHPNLPFYFNIGRWTSGKIVGDVDALPEHLRNNAGPSKV